MSTLDARAGFERLALYHHVEAAWGTAITAADNWFQLLEKSKAVPDIKRPKTAMALGTGKAYDYAAHHVPGLPVARLISTHPMTPVALRDLFMLFAQDAQDGSYVYQHADAAVTEFATVVAKTAASGADSVFKGTSMIPHQIDIDLPQAAGEAADDCTVKANWLGVTAIPSDDQTITTPSQVEDASDYLHTRDCTFSVGATSPAVGLASASFSFTNGLSHFPPDGTGAASGATLGKSGVTGSVSVIDTVGSDAYAALRTSYDSATPYTPLDLLFDWVTPSTSFVIPVVITTVSEPTDIGGNVAYSFGFVYGGAVADYWKLEVPAIATSPYYNAP